MFVYNILVALLLLVAGPFLLTAEKKRAGVWQKLGFIPKKIREQFLDSKNTVWFHAVSVGEFNAAWPLIQEFKQKHPQNNIVISTATKAGQKLVVERASKIATIIYFPLDLWFATRSWLDAINPKLVVIVETEMWPGFTNQCKKRDIPVVVVNGRISLKSAKNYTKFKFFFGAVLRRLTTIVAQSNNEATRYRQIGGDNLPIIVSGNLKYDNLNPIPDAQQDALRQLLGIAANDLVVVAGSTHEGEESAFIEFLKTNTTKDINKNIKLIIAPRHPERWDRVAAAIEAAGFRARRFSRSEVFTNNGENEIYLLDTIGKLFQYYSLATVAFVGGTLVPVGGHNLVEPYAYKTPVICGKYLFKTADVANELSSIDAITVVADNTQLSQQLNILLTDDQTRVRKGNTGYEWLSQSSGALNKTIDVLSKIVSTSKDSKVLAGDCAR